MKRKIMSLIAILLLVLGITACKKEEKKDEPKDEDVKITQKLTVDKKKDGIITEGTLEDYKFKVTDKVTDRVKIEMEDGGVILAVLSNKDTPITIKNFKKLVQDKFYNGLIFHRVIKDFMIQGGDPLGNGTGGSKDTIKGEFTSNGVKNKMSHKRGVISMARSSAPNSASSQFFIMHQDNPGLDGDYASFGRVFAGMDEVDKIANTKTDEMDKPVKDQKIKSINFITVE